MSIISRVVRAQLSGSGRTRPNGSLRAVIATCLGASGIFGSHVAFADDYGTAPAAPSLLEEIVVTARYRAEFGPPGARAATPDASTSAGMGPG